MTTNVLVTGALGFVGLNCVHDLASRDVSVIALSRREPDAESLTFLQTFHNIRWVIGDITDRIALANLVSHENISHILHVAALTASGNEDEMAAQMFEVNARGTLNVLEAAKEKVKRVVFVSSSGIYSAAPPTPLKKEEDPVSITGLYAICKQTSEHLCRRYSELYGLSTAVGRLGTTYGPMERASKSRQGMSAIHQLVHLVLKQNHIKVHGSKIARDFCHSQDIAKAFSTLLLAEKLSYPLYNVAATQAYPLSDAIDALSTVLDFSWEEVNQPKDADLVQTGLNARAGMSINRLQTDTHWQPQYDLKTGVLAYLEWLQAWQGEKNEN